MNTEVLNIDKCWEDEDGVMYSADRKILIKIRDPDHISSYDIPYGTEEICLNAFDNCSSLTSITRATHFYSI